MSNLNSNLEAIWIAHGDVMPDRCCSCGMFSDRRVTLKAVDFVKQDPKIGCLSAIFHLIVQVLLPSVSLLWMLFQKGDLGDPVTKKKKLKVRISQCLLCQHDSPEVIQGQAGPPQRVLVEVHPEFKRLFDQQNGPTEP